MIKVLLKTICIDNFKGIKHLEYNFEGDGPFKIYASNGQGKTTIKNAWEWVLGQDIKNFIPNINGQELIAETKVSVKLLINDDYDYELTRISKPKVQNGVKVGNESVYMIDGIEMPQKTYLAQLNSIFTNNAVENMKVLTDKDYFNSDTTSWKWTNRRKLLLQMCNINEVSAEIIKQDKYEPIRVEIEKGFATSDIKSKYDKEVKQLKDLQLKNKTLIEQKQSEINEYLGIDFDKTGKELGIAKAKLTKLLKSSNKENQSEELAKLQSELLTKTQELSKLQISYTNKKQALENTKILLFNQANTIKAQLEQLKNKETICPYCHRELEEDMLEENEEKIADLTNQYNDLYKQFEENNQKIANMEELQLIQDLENQIKDLKSTIENTKVTNLNKLSKETQTALEQQISDLEKLMAKKQDLEKWGVQVKQWKKESLEYADKIVEFENKLNLLQEYMKEQTDLISQTINSKFENGVSWCLYNTNYVGTLEETCVCMYNNKLYPTLSNGEKNICDIEVVKSLQKYFDVELPLLCDNMETVTIPFNCNSQTIEFCVKSNTKINNCEKF